ncbi:hypothetical protein Aph01nite_24140 [Acrocarpospora phusangensis]|uniref:Fumarate reductase subunit C n=1 Tax=Acrocarpospora phusangensis TaxID=1070424 RepID=A0A919Q7X7_9ACTN|nr:hypothetical protein [Acrocarpospora phusangensis]GIH24104.1 hypothetical protein Aph01nite_24140 [Acrocarpospora phusangensis]
MTYSPPRDRLWFLRRRAYLVFVLRELTSLFVAWSVVYLILLLDAAAGGALPAFWAWAAGPWVLAVNVLALGATVFHSVTFLNLAPKATVIRLDGWRVPGFMISGGNYSAWLAVSVLILWVLS